MKKLLLSLIVLLIAAAGCVTRVQNESFPPGPQQPAQTPPSGNRYPPAPTAPVSDKRITIDPALEKVIRIVRINTSLSPEGYLKLQLNVHNLTDAPVHFGYRVDWVDQEGQILPMFGVGELKWDLLAGETSFLAMTAPTVDVKDFRVTFLAN